MFILPVDRFVLFSVFRSYYLRVAAGAPRLDPGAGDASPVVAGGVVASGASTVLPPGAASGMELRGWEDGACPCGAMTAPEEPGAS
jgi:hypothetical protein